MAKTEQETYLKEVNKEVNQMAEEVTYDTGEAKTKSKKSRMNTRYMVRIGIFAAIAFVVMYLEFPLAALFPAYLQVDFSEAVVFIGGVVLGPVAVVLIELIKNILHFMLRGGTGGIGETANFIVGVGLILPPIMILKRKPSSVRLIVGLIAGIMVMIMVAAVSNYYVFLPLYKIPVEVRMGMLIPIILPFNAIKGLIVSVVCVILYKAMYPIFRHLR